MSVKVILTETLDKLTLINAAKLSSSASLLFPRISDKTTVVFHWLQPPFKRIMKTLGNLDPKLSLLCLPRKGERVWDSCLNKSRFPIDRVRVIFRALCWTS